MSFISYAQNFEDVMLWRALSHIKNGFYIDIGAQDPIVDSVSMAFYEHGWRGVHIEPTAQYSKKLREARPDEMVVQVAIGQGADDLTFYEFHDTGLSTADPVIAETHKKNGFAATTVVVPLLSLDSLLQKFAGHPIHWLKLDVEGFEKSVLESWQSAATRPWILVIESTAPSTQTATHASWEGLVLSKGYEFAYFDGLNRFYVSQEQSRLKSAFDRPPNIFDQFALSGTASQPFYQLVAEKAELEKKRALEQSDNAVKAEAQVVLLENRLQHVETKVATAEARAQQAEIIASQAETALNAIYNSTSWRISAPLRLARYAIGNVFRSTKLDELEIEKERIRLLHAHARLYINRRPILKRAVLGVLNKLPSVKASLSQMSSLSPVPTTPFSERRTTFPADLKSLPSRARHIHKHLEAAIKRRQKDNG